MEIAIKGGIAINFGGGFHHAFPAHGEGLCFFSDAALSILSCRAHGLLKQNDPIIMIDLDAHRGNGFEYIFRNDPFVHIFDMYNFQMSNCIISEVAMATAGDFPTEEVSINFGKIEWSYTQQKRSGGGAAGNVAASWDLQRNCKV